MQVHPFPGLERPLSMLPRSRGAAPAGIEALPEDTFQSSSDRAAIPQARPAALPESSPGKAGEVVIEAEPGIAPESLEKLRATAQRAIAYFAEHFGPVTQPLRFQVGGGALRAGYNIVDDVIGLPKLGNVHNAGLDSADIINHEIFHALVLDAYPELPSNEDGANGAVRLHESLADYFAHALEPDESFGEGYYTDQPYLRRYHTDLRLSLASGAHAQGNALTTLLLEQGVTHQEVRSFLEAGEFDLEGLGKSSPHLLPALRKEQEMAVPEQVVGDGYTHSAKGRYWLHGTPLELSFVPNARVLEEHPDFHVVWCDKNGQPSPGYTAAEIAPHTFSITGTPGAKSEKVIARFYDGDRVIGFRPFYFGVRGSEPAAEEASAARAS